MPQRPHARTCKSPPEIPQAWIFLDMQAHTVAAGSAAILGMSLMMMAITVNKSTNMITIKIRSH